LKEKKTTQKTTNKTMIYAAPKKTGKEDPL
jgi:hypothetical protein